MKKKRREGLTSLVQKRGKENRWKRKEKMVILPGEAHLMDAHFIEVDLSIDFVFGKISNVTVMRERKSQPPGSKIERKIAFFVNVECISITSGEGRSPSRIYIHQ